MRLLTFTESGRTRAGLEIDGQIVDLPRGAEALASARPGAAGGLPESLQEILEAGEPALDQARLVQEWVGQRLRAGQRPTGARGEPVVFERASVQLRPPIQRPGKIICLGRNYAEHAAEGGAEVPTIPIMFAKFASNLIGHGEPIVIPRVVQRLDYEAELAVVIGRRAKHVSRDQAFDYVAGYMNFHDVSARDLQFETSQWFRGKCGDTFAPCGPYLVTKDEVPDPHRLDIRCILNGEVMQNSNTRHLIFDVPYLIQHITQTLTLEPGDIISTGTPSGVGEHRKPPRFLRPGDVVRVEVEGLGTLENPVISE